MRAPLWIPSDAPPVFPDPSDFDSEGLIAGGGDLGQARLLAAYRAGIFPWFSEEPILWWSPDPRSLITPSSLHLSRSLRRTLRKTSWVVTCGSAMAEVMKGCAERPEGTWLTPEMQEAYLRLEAQDHALSYEVWDKDDLVGGLYGVLVGGLFAGESKFHRRTDASKIALACAVTDLFDRGVRLFDVQFTTEHLQRLGVHEVTRAEYLRQVKLATSASIGVPEKGRDLLPKVRRLLNLASAPSGS